MKKRHGLARAVEPIRADQLGALPTGALLARLQRLRQCEESIDSSDLSETEAAAVDGAILFKSDQAWHSAWADLKAILATREHKTSKPR
jgi:hypothetical protein